MEVILKNDVNGLGSEGDLVRVADGYARNFLIPKGFALIANDKNRRILEHEKRIQEVAVSRERAEAEQLMQKLSGVTCTIHRLAGENDRLFGSVTSIDIAESLLKQGFEVDRRRIDLDETIRELGTFTVAIKLHMEISAQITVHVVPEKSE